MYTQQQLQSLMETLNTTEPHYIRCVKPNAVLKPGIFENYNVLNQLRCGVCMCKLFYCATRNSCNLQYFTESLAQSV
jgi:hypothetical protein